MTESHDLRWSTGKRGKSDLRPYFFSIFKTDSPEFERYWDSVAGAGVKMWKGHICWGWLTREKSSPAAGALRRGSSTASSHTGRLSPGSSFPGSAPREVSEHHLFFTQTLQQKHVWLCIILPSIKIAFRTANTAPTSILLWAAAKRWRSQEEQIPGNNFPMERRVNLVENSYLPTKIPFAQNPSHLE